MNKNVQNRSSIINNLYIKKFRDQIQAPSIRGNNKEMKNMPSENSDNGAAHANENSAHYPEEPIIIALYGVMVEDPEQL